jgi:uridine kinase
MTRVIVVAGPSGSGKSTAVARSGLPVLQLDAFYRDRDLPGMPRWLGDVDWEHPGAFDTDAAVRAVESLLTSGSVSVRAHDVVREHATELRTLRLDGPCIVLEGVMAPAVARRLSQPVDAIYFLRRSTVANVVTRVVRDIRDRGRSPWRAIARSLHVAALERAQRRDARALGAVLVSRRGVRVALAVERDERCCDRDPST